MTGPPLLKTLRRALLVALAGLACLPALSASASAAPPALRHVFVIVLENESESTSFGSGSPSPYLAHTLPSMGVFVPNYFAVGHASLDNYIAMISGQPPNPSTKADCSGMFTDYAAGTGCVYPAGVQTLAGQLQAAGDSWKGYMQSMPVPCSHPTPNGTDTEQGEGTASDPNDTYATRHDPFVWFHSIVDDSASCNSHVVNLSALSGDLSSAATTPNLSFITPDVCYDGHDKTCKNSSEPGGYNGINSFLSTWVPQITGSPAFKQDGLLAVIFDEAASSDTSACCGETGGGGGQTGAVLVSPAIQPGSTTMLPYNHYSLLASLEDLFGLPRLANAGAPGTTTFGSDVYNAMAASPGTPTPATPTTPASVTPSCPSGRSVTVRLPSGRKRLRHASVRVDGRAVRVTGKAHPQVKISLVGRKGTSVTVIITGRSGKHKYRSVRHYRPCHTA